MSREIYTYTDLTKLGESKLFQEIRYFPQVTVSADLRKDLIGTQARDFVNGIFANDSRMLVTEFHNLAQAVYGDWGTDQGKFGEMILLSEYVRQKLNTAAGDKKETNWLIGCMRNLGSILSAIILLEQADVRPEHLVSDGERNLDLMLGAWKYLIEKDPVIQAFRKDCARHNTKETWEPILRKAFRTEASFATTEAIVFHGLYYITPLQEKIICSLEKAGYRVIFLIPYDERYPFVYEIWDETYSEKRGYPLKVNWHMEKSSWPDPYGDLFEGKKDISSPDRLQVREYASVMEFVNDVKNIRSHGYSIYSSDYKTANKILKDYFPEEYGDRKILSYPIGQFVSVLNQMWDEERQTIILDEDSLIECFSSGWLSVNGTSGRQYLQDLTYLLPFFTGCHTVDEWTARIELLKKIRKDSIDPFLMDLDPEESVARWQEAIGNPMANFSMFAVETEKLDVILSLIRQLLDMASDLFQNNQVIRVSEHINKLDQILRRYEVSNEMYAEERAIVGDIFEKLGQPGIFDARVAPSDIANALNLFLCGRLEEGEIQTNRIGLVYPMYQIDAACIKNNSKVHVCMCDVNAMPGGNKEYIWPLTAPVIHDCYKRTQNPLLINMMQIMESTAICNRYFMYVALKNKDVTVSWVSTVGEKLLAPSPYIKLILSATGQNLSRARRHQITFSRVADAVYGRERVDEYDNDKMPSDAIKEAKMDYAVCPMKYVLGYVVEKYPTYSSDFQQNYALNAFISAIYNLMKDKGMTVDQVYRNVMELFPGLRKVEKRQVYDYMSYDRRENDMDYGNRTECGGFFYTDERIKLHYPNPQVREMAIGRYGKLLTPDGRKGMNLYEVMEATNEEEIVGRKDVVKTTCMFCPHIDYCRNAIYYGDQENFYD
ncbi:hypothetical protein ACTQ4Q_07460 [Bacillota bacterium LCP21S3_D9]